MKSSFPIFDLAERIRKVFMNQIYMLKKLIIAGFCIVQFSTIALSQDTFSIVAADSATREVGSAGASCIDLFNTIFSDPGFLGDLIPDTGAINSQSYYLKENQNNARSRMRAGDSPKEIITWLIANDVESNPEVRQYGIVGFNGKKTSAEGFTGTNCFDYKNHLTGSINGIYYSIQGNILLGQSILDSMELLFRNAQGNLACRLMAAMQGANTVGADTRCTPNGISSMFAFLKVAQPKDVYGSPSFNVSVKTRNGAKKEPIDSLQTLFDLKQGCYATNIKETQLESSTLIYPNPSTGNITIELPNTHSEIRITNSLGQPILNTETIESKLTIQLEQNGMYFIQIITPQGAVQRKILISQ